MTCKNLGKVIMKRKIYDKLLQWKNEKDGATALMIEEYIIPNYEVLHSESRKNVTMGLIDTLRRWEERGTNDEQQRKVRNIIRWQRIGCIVVKISETLNVSLKEALDLFYKSETCRRFHDEETGLYLQGNLYVLNDFLAEISKPVA